MDWPKALIVELAGRRCTVFLGAGASAGSKARDDDRHPKTWAELLASLAGLAGLTTDPVIVDLINKEKFLDAAEILIASVSRADFTAFIREELETPRFGPSVIHEHVLSIDPKIVVTTNYDQIYDNYCRTGDAKDGYNVCRYYDTYLVSDLRSSVRSIIKAHGCVTDPSRIVLSRSQYHDARRSFPFFYRVLDSIFLTNTLLFIGYGLSDPDIQLVLENASIAANSSHPHYAVMPDNIHPSIKSSIQRAYNIQFVEFEAGKYDQVESGLEELAEEVALYRSTHVT